MKILIAYGPGGPSICSHQNHWNWCNRDEIVGTHGFVCDNGEGCGCNRSFDGIVSAKATTKALVRDVPFSVVLKAIEQLYKTTFNGWGGVQRIAENSVLNFMALLAEIEKYPADTILEVSPEGLVRTAITA